MYYYKPTVMKFGGTSVEDARAFERVAHIVRERGAARPVVVVSAMSRVTDALLASVRTAAGGDAPAAAAALTPHLERHAEVARELLTTERAAVEIILGTARAELAELLREVAMRPALHARLQDEVVAYGERLSAALLAAVLRAKGLPARYADARRCIVTEETHGGAATLWAETERSARAELAPLVKASEIPVLGGFIGAAPSGVTTTLGRGGSDYTAALVGAALAAREIQIWTDVTGVLTADPRLITDARTIPYLTYDEAAELAYLGAKVLHPKTIRPAAERHIPVRICNSRAPEEPGTFVSADGAPARRTVKVITHKAGVSMLHVRSAHMLGTGEFLSAIFDVLNAHHAAASVVNITEDSATLSLGDTSALPLIVAELERIGSVKVEKSRALIGVVGEGLRVTQGVTARVFGAISDINVSLISQGVSTSNLSFVVEEERAREVVRRLHDTFFEPGVAEEIPPAAFASTEVSQVAA
jgi:aspartate kinase